MLIRGATDGWVPYPFLSPAQGYPVVAAWVALVAGAFAGVASLLRRASIPSTASMPVASTSSGGLDAARRRFRR